MRVFWIFSSELLKISNPARFVSDCVCQLSIAELSEVEIVELYEQKLYVTAGANVAVLYHFDVPAINSNDSSGNNWHLTGTGIESGNSVPGIILLP